MTAIELRSNCEQCSALCCIAFPSEDMPGFAAEKEAGQPCPHLDTCGRCTIYADREQKGFGGCLQFECFGAGQHVTHTLFDGNDWRKDADLLAPMVDAFLNSRRLFELLFLASIVRERGPDKAQIREINEIEAALHSAIMVPGKPFPTGTIEAQLRRLFSELERCSKGAGKAD